MNQTQLVNVIGLVVADRICALKHEQTQLTRQAARTLNRLGREIVRALVQAQIHSARASRRRGEAVEVYNSQLDRMAHMTDVQRDEYFTMHHYLTQVSEPVGDELIRLLGLMDDVPEDRTSEALEEAFAVMGVRRRRENDSEVDSDMEMQEAIDEAVEPTIEPLPTITADQFIDPPPEPAQKRVEEIKKRVRKKKTEPRKRRIKLKKRKA